jgi:hypothetical protein
MRLDLRHYAARAIEQEISTTEQHLNALKSELQKLVQQRARAGSQPVVSAADRPRRRAKMTKAQRDAVSQRMRRYWAERRKSKQS